MIINEKGKLFGIINIVDLIVIAIVVALAIFSVSRFSTKAVTTAAQDDIIITYYSEECPTDVAKSISAGARLSDLSKNTDMGVATNIEVLPSVSYAFSADGKTFVSPKDGISALKITGKIKAQKFDHGIIVGGNKYGVGHSFTLLAGNTEINLRVYDIR